MIWPPVFLTWSDNNGVVCAFMNSLWWTRLKPCQSEAALGANSSLILFRAGLSDVAALLCLLVNNLLRALSVSIRLTSKSEANNLNVAKQKNERTLFRANERVLRTQIIWSKSSKKKGNHQNVSFWPQMASGGCQKLRKITKPEKNSCL